MPEKSQEELIEEIRSLRAQLAALEASKVCWTERTAPCAAQLRLAGILTIADDAIISADKDLRITFFNHGAERIFGYRAKEVIGQPIYMLVPERFRAAQKALLDAFIHGSDATIKLGGSQGIVGLRKDGTEFPAEGSASRIRHGSNVIVTVILRDVTERRRVEAALAQARDQALEASRVKSAFLANMSHEIRTPMNGVTGMIELLMQTPLNEVQREYAQVIYDSAQALLTLINDILDFSKIEANKLQLEIVDFEPRSLVEGVAELLVAKARAKGLSLMTYIDPELPATLRGDPVRLRQVLLNLGDNAIKFTERGEVVIKAVLLRREDAAVDVEFSVRDTGIGIAPDRKEALFQPFVQADDSTTRRFGGTGLGLSISKGLVELMGGRIDVESEPGKGSLFWFRVPLAVGKAAAAGGDEGRAAQLHGLRVLVVDDNPTACEILHRYLDSWGIENDAASGSVEALALLRAAAARGRPYHIAVIDLRMPEYDGLTLARWVRSDAALRDLKMILLTAFDARGQGEEALRLGFAAYLTKPVKQSHLFDCIVSLVQPRPEPERFGFAAAAAEAIQAPARSPSQPKGRILLVEDNAVNQRVVTLQLEHLGYAVDVVGSGQKAVQAVAEGNYDLVLMDCHMPEMDGFQATQRIRKHEAKTGRRTVIVALTANAMQGDRERCIGAGMDDYLSKPVSLDALRAVLERWIPQGAARPAVEGEKARRGEEGASGAAGAASVAPAAEEAAPLQVEALYEAFGGQERTIASLLNLYLNTTPKLLERLCEAVQSRAARDAHGAAHEIKGSSNMIGAYRVGEAALAVEKAAKETAWERCGPALERLTAVYRETEAYIRRLLDRMAAGQADPKEPSA